MNAKLVRLLTILVFRSCEIVVIQGWQKKLGVPFIMWWHHLFPLVGIGLTDLPKIGGAFYNVVASFVHPGWNRVN